MAKTIYGGWGDCALRDAGQRPLWRGLRSGFRQQMRFTFNEGHGAYTIAVTIDQRSNGSGRLAVIRITGDAGVNRVLIERTRRVTVDQLAELNRLAEASGTWDQEIGIWDGDDFFMHCETLDMERVTNAGYRIATVSISCNQPAKLMPLVTYVAELAGLKSSANGRMY